tara:strand:+ start:4345 stop:5070 length:726 start_codon:yes stop_codon:yes gene_type:complete
MQDILKDIVAHTHGLGFLTLVKVSNDDDDTVISSMTEDRSVVLAGKTHSKVSEFKGTFGMPNLGLLALHLKNPEYGSGKVAVIEAERNDELVPTHLHFENAGGDFENDYRFMNRVHIEEKLKTVKFKGAAFDIEFQPSIASINRMKLQAAANPEEVTFNAYVEDSNLIFRFGDASTHAGKFTFQADVAALKHTWSWPVAQTIAILSLPGTVTMSLSDQGAMKLNVDSGLTSYDYILPAQAK